MLERNEFAKAFNFTFPEGELKNARRVRLSAGRRHSEAGDRFTHAGFTFVVHSKDGPRLERIKVWKPKSTTATSQGNLGPTSTSHPTLEPVPERKPSREIELVTTRTS